MKVKFLKQFLLYNIPRVLRASSQPHAGADIKTSISFSIPGEISSLSFYTVSFFHGCAIFLVEFVSCCFFFSFQAEKTCRCLIDSLWDGESTEKNGGVLEMAVTWITKAWECHFLLDFLFFSFLNSCWLGFAREESRYSRLEFISNEVGEDGLEFGNVLS